MVSARLLFFSSFLLDLVSLGSTEGYDPCQWVPLVTAFLLFAVTLVAAEEQHRNLRRQQMEFQTCSG